MEAAQSSRETVVVTGRPVRPAAVAMPGALAWHEVAAADAAVVARAGLVREGGCG